MWRGIFLDFVLLSCGILIISRTAASSVCCFPKQFESLMFAENTGNEDTSKLAGLTYGMARGTIRTAYDAINKRTYMFTKYIQTSSDDPGTLSVNVTTIQDYKNNVRYQVFLGILCEEGPIDDNLFIECIPEGAEVVSEETIGDTSTQVVSYLLNVTLENMDYQMVVSVIHTDKATRECVPVRMSITDNPPDKDADVIIADVVDITKGIKDTTIFNPPPNCSNDTRHKSPWTI